MKLRENTSDKSLLYIAIFMQRTILMFVKIKYVHIQYVLD